jgi:hypothetical protein
VWHGNVLVPPMIFYTLLNLIGVLCSTVCDNDVLERKLCAQVHANYLRDFEVTESMALTKSVKLWYCVSAKLQELCGSVARGSMRPSLNKLRASLNAASRALWASLTERGLDKLGVEILYAGFEQSASSRPTPLIDTCSKRGSLCCCSFASSWEPWKSVASETSATPDPPRYPG